MSRDRSFREIFSPTRQRGSPKRRTPVKLQVQKDPTLSGMGLPPSASQREEEGVVLDRQTRDYIHSRLDPEDARVSGLAAVVRHAKGAVSRSWRYLTTPPPALGRSLDRLHAFTHAPRGWLLPLCRHDGFLLPLSPLFPPDDPSQEVRDAFGKNLRLQFLVDDAHVPARLIVREVQVRYLEDAVGAWDDRKPASSLPMVERSGCCPDNMAASASLVACKKGADSVTSENSISEGKEDVARGRTRSCEDKSSRGSKEPAHAAKCSERFASAYPTFSVSPHATNNSTKSNDADGFRSSLKSFVSRLPEEEKNQVSKPPQTDSSFSKTDDSQNDVDNKDSSCVSLAYNHPAVDTLAVCKELATDSGWQARTEPRSPRGRKDVRIMRESREALVPEMSDSRAFIRGHYLAKDLETERQLMVFLYRANGKDGAGDDPGEGASQGSLCGSYSRQMLSTDKHLRWRFEIHHPL